MSRQPIYPYDNQLVSLAWDSVFLGFGVARLTLHETDPTALAAHLAAARRAGLRLLYLVADPADARSNASAQQANGWLVDRKVTFAMPVVPADAHLLTNQHVVPTYEWSAGLENLALQSGEYSRFRLDPNFTPGVFEALYRQWLRKSLTHELAREVLGFWPVATAGGQVPPEPPAPVGLLTLGVKAGRADIGLLAVDARMRGQHIGQQLVMAARQRTAAWGLPALQVVTQLDNAAACAFYRRCGFAEDAVEHLYHCWL